MLMIIKLTEKFVGLSAGLNGIGYAFRFTASHAVGVERSSFTTLVMPTAKEFDRFLAYSDRTTEISIVMICQS
ncbi:hypothetical protein CA984_05180 [Streptosporangium minutum]|uniref:Uncharacterized protein n=1 Tax=Streptosporangium minutum TaxID=569862 RepID=A0A243RUP0_9ACTN|nr:hypothetical protein CA984_05180 [Streptosporangium minutum]